MIFQYFNDSETLGMEYLKAVKLSLALRIPQKAHRGQEDATLTIRALLNTVCFINWKSERH